MRTEAVEGLRYVLGHRYLRNIAACTGTLNLFGNIGGVILLLYIVRGAGLNGRHRRDRLRHRQPRRTRSGR